MTAASSFSMPNPFDPEHAPRLDPGVWHRVLTHVRLTNPSLNRKWFEDLVPRQLSNGVIHVTCETLAQLNWLTGPCQQAFNAAQQAVTNRLSVVMFHCPRLTTTGVMDLAEGGSEGAWSQGAGAMPLNPDYVFENFITGPGNNLAHAASVAVSERPGDVYNPLFIHGGCGLGKTHLLQAICQHLLEQRPELKILYLSCDDLINQFMASVQGGDMAEFRNRFRRADVLVIDDIHFLKGRERTQEEFFHTFNTLYQAKKQIILSADAAPNEVPELENRLISRFNWGLVAAIDRPCFDTRVAILRTKSELRGLTLDDEVIQYIAGRIDTNTRELEGAINKVQGLAQLGGGKNGTPVPITLDLVRKALGDPTQAHERPRVTIDTIVDAVVRYYGVKVSDLHSKRRHRSIAWPRQVCMFLARKHTRYSLEEVGGYFGGRDHTTVLHGVRAVKKQVENDEEIAGQIHAIEQQLDVA